MDTIQEKDSQSLKLSDNEDEGGILSLPPKVQRFVHLYMTGQYTYAKLAEMLEVHPNTLSNWAKRKDVKAVIADMQVATHDMVGVQLKAMSTIATGKLIKLIDSPIDGVALQAVKDILDRTGHKPKQEIKVDKTIITYEEKLSDLINNVIDVTDYTDVEYIELEPGQETEQDNEEGEDNEYNS